MTRQKKDLRIIRRGGKEFFRFDMEGLDLMVAELDDMTREMAGQVGKDIVIDTLRQTVYKRARQNVPVDRGLLRESIRMNKGRQDRRGVVGSVFAGFPRRATGTGKSRAAYALQQEFGAQGKPGTPFMRPAFDGYEQEIAGVMGRSLKLQVIKWRFNKRVGRA